MIKGFMFAQYIDDENCWFHGLINVNPNFAVIPDFLINFTVKRVIYIIMGKMQSAAGLQSSLEVFQKRKEDRKEYYEKLKEKLEEIKN